MNHPVPNRIGRRGFRPALAGCAALAGSFALAVALQAQTNHNFNTGTNSGWENWLPEEYIGADTNQGSMLPAVTIVTNPVSAGNYAVKLESCVALAAAGGGPYYNDPAVGSFFTNGAPLANFTMTGEFFDWTNSQSQIFGIGGRMQLPIPAVNQPGEYASTPNPVGYVLAYVNRRSAQAWRFDNGVGSLGGSDELRFLDTNVPIGSEWQQMGNNGAFNGRGQSVPGRSSSPDSTNGHYRLIFTASGTELTGQIVDVSTGLPMSFGGPLGPTNMLRPNYSIAVTSAGTYGFVCHLGSSATAPGVGGTGLWASYDDFAIVPGVVSLESAAAAEGPYAQDTAAGIEVYPQRFTVPASGSARFYRIKWTDRGNDTPFKITSITRSGNNVVLTYE